MSFVSKVGWRNSMRPPCKGQNLLSYLRGTERVMSVQNLGTSNPQGSKHDMVCIKWTQRSGHTPLATMLRILVTEAFIILCCGYDCSTGSVIVNLGRQWTLVNNLSAAGTLQVGNLTMLISCSTVAESGRISPHVYPDWSCS